ncbi:hypothetical protein M3Y97_00164700 [Aphelenchoides bicaudatus]|nr:hypothetical protein M3Y97_00164700 [Aphelenchoides bicaudatus]
MNSYLLFALVIACSLAVCLAKDEKSEGLAPLGKCADWCEDHCKSECKKKGFGGDGVTHECKGEKVCNCKCPATDAECSTAFCDAFCTKHSGGKKFENKCKDKQTCQCKFESGDSMTSGGKN